MRLLCSALAAFEVSSGLVELDNVPPVSGDFSRPRFESVSDVFDLKSFVVVELDPSVREGCREHDAIICIIRHVGVSLFRSPGESWPGELFVGLGVLVHGFCLRASFVDVGLGDVCVVGGLVTAMYGSGVPSSFVFHRWEKVKF